jgi:hypothetical protein
VLASHYLSSYDLLACYRSTVPKNAPAVSIKSRLPALAERVVVLLLLELEELAEEPAEGPASVLSVTLAVRLLSVVGEMLVSIDVGWLSTFAVAKVELLIIALVVATALARCE